MDEHRSKIVKTEFLIAICCQTGNKCQSKTLFLMIFDPRLSVVKSVFDCCLSGVNTREHLIDKQLTLKAPITTAADYKFCDIFPNFRQK